MSVSKLSPLKIGFLITAISAVINGIWPTATRVIYAEGGNIAFAMLVATWVRALSLVGFCVWTKRPLFASKKDIKQAFIGGIFQAVSLVSLYSALALIPGPLVIIILFTHTLMLLFYMAWRDEIRLDAFVITITVTALVGLSFVLDIWHKQPNTNMWGFALAFLAALATLSRVYVYGRQTQSQHPIVVGAQNFLVAACLILSILFWQTPVVPTSIAGLAYTFMGCLTLTLGTFGMFYGIALLGSFRWSLFIKLEPIFAALFATLILGEILKLSQYAGMALVLSSLILYQVVDYKKSAKESK